jgi:medium-chain acyl-[acyl-carrier-protein] hydrolase
MAAMDPRALQRWAPRPDATLVVYGIAHAGAGAAPWRPVALAATAAVEVCGFRLPGRENRIGTPSHVTVDAAAEEIATVLAAEAASHGKPMVVAGACSGALLGLVAIGRLGADVPVVGLVVIRQPAPVRDGLTSGRGVGRMSSDELRVWLHDNRLTPDALLRDDSAFEFFEPVLRIDLAMVEGYVLDGGPIGCPVYLIRSRDRSDAPDVEAWERETTAGVRVVSVPFEGDVLAEHPARLGDVLAALRGTGVASNLAAEDPECGSGLV